MEARVDGKTVLVTGSTQGIGRAIALECAQSGAQTVIVSGLDQSDGEAVVAEIEAAGCRAGMLVEDLSIPGGGDRLFERALSQFGPIDALVNSAGVTNRASALEASREDWRLIFQVNTEEPFFLIQNFIRARKESGQPGAVVNILSMNAHGGARDLTVYSASKAALSLITKNAAHHHRFDRIRLNGINLGWANTPAERHLQATVLGKGDAWLGEAEARQPFGRLVVPEDVARLAVYLLSDVSVPMTGSIIDQEQSVTGAIDG